MNLHSLLGWETFVAPATLVLELITVGLHMIIHLPLILESLAANDALEPIVNCMTHLHVSDQC